MGNISGKWGGNQTVNKKSDANGSNKADLVNQ